MCELPPVTDGLVAWFNAACPEKSFGVSLASLCDVREVVIYDRVLTADEMNQVDLALAARHQDMPEWEREIHRKAFVEGWHAQP